MENLTISVDVNSSRNETNSSFRSDDDKRRKPNFLL